MAWAKAKPEHAYASYDAKVKVISHDGGIPADGLNLLIDQAKKDAESQSRDIQEARSRIQHSPGSSKGVGAVSIAEPGAGET